MFGRESVCSFECKSSSTITMEDISLFSFAFDNPLHSDNILHLKDNGKVHMKIHINNMALSAFTTYFASMFTNNMKETNQKEIEIEIAEDDAPLFRSLVQSFYTGTHSTSFHCLLFLLHLKS